MHRARIADRILRRRSNMVLRFFEWQFTGQLRRHFNAVRLSRSSALPALNDRPIVIYSNHASWWDAIVYVYLGRKLFRDRIGYGPIDADQLRRYPFLDRLGIFGIDLERFAGAANFLSVSRRLLVQPNAMLWITAEGQFTDIRPRPIHLRPGLAHLPGADTDLTFLPLAIEYGFWNDKRPELLLRFGEPLQSASTGKHALLARLETGLATTMDGLAREAITRDASLFDSLLGSRKGIHPLYDLMRRK
jgi:1-acyl-sn-glycerol-3-phosphate acyltransferase